MYWLNILIAASDGQLRVNLFGATAFENRGAEMMKLHGNYVDLSHKSQVGVAKHRRQREKVGIFLIAENRPSKSVEDSSGPNINACNAAALSSYVPCAARLSLYNGCITCLG
jgi:hypothetical protein